MKIVIRVDKGPNVGTQFEIGLRSYRAIGRGSGKDVTVQLSNDGDRMIEPDDVKRVEDHLAKRSPSTPGADPMRLGAFRRGRDILLDDEKVSRTHAMLFLDEERGSIVDLLSTNGTIVNGKRVGDADLNDGDIISIGKTRFVVKIVEGDPPR